MEPCKIELDNDYSTTDFNEPDYFGQKSIDSPTEAPILSITDTPELCSLDLDDSAKLHSNRDEDKYSEKLNDTSYVCERMNTYRFSMCNLKGTQDADLDAILKDLFEYEFPKSQNKNSSIDSKKNLTKSDSQDNDTGLSDCSSKSPSDTCSSTFTDSINLSENKELSTTDKINLAMQKIMEASVKKLVIKVFTDDGGTKLLVISEEMQVHYVMRLLASKNHVVLGPHWALVEHITDLCMERVYEDHELLLENLMLWPRDSNNRLLFVMRPEKVLLFESPSLFFSGDRSYTCDSDFAKEYFCGSGFPNVEGSLYIKSKFWKGWKKYHSILRASGLYYIKKNLFKMQKKFICLSSLVTENVYHGVDWKKKYKAPTAYCFAIKHPCFQVTKSNERIKFICVKNKQLLNKWISAIRILKYGQQLMTNYEMISTIKYLNKNI